MTDSHAQTTQRLSKAPARESERRDYSRIVDGLRFEDTDEPVKESAKRGRDAIADFDLKNVAHIERETTVR